jgi:hypothetical protein
MQYKHNEAGAAVMKELMGDKLWTAENPFYRFSDISKPILNPEGTPNGMHSGNANQMFAKKIRKDTYTVWLGFVFGYNKSTHENAYVLMSCQYNAATGKITKVEARYALGSYARETKPMKTKRTGTPATIYAEIATNMKALMVADAAAYWKGFREYYANRPQCGYYMD